MAILIGEKRDLEKGFLQAEYDEKLILDGLTAYRAMIAWMNAYFKGHMDMRAGEVIGHMCFMEGDFTDRADCWDLWEKVVADFLKEQDKEKKKS